MNATNTHTPGPWHVGHDSTGTLLIVAGDGENFDGGPWVYDSDKPETRPISEADARLIAAAPALLAALEEVQRALACDRDGLTYTHPEHGAICLEEVKYLVVDEALRIARGS